MLTILEKICQDVAGDIAVLDYAGESRQIRQEGSALAATLGVALILIYLVWRLSYNRSAIADRAVRFGAVGHFRSLVVDLSQSHDHQHLFASRFDYLVGLVAKNGILFVEFANTLQEQGKSKLEALSKLRRLDCVGVDDFIRHRLGA